MNFISDGIMSNADVVVRNPALFHGTRWLLDIHSMLYAYNTSYNADLHKGEYWLNFGKSNNSF